MPDPIIWELTKSRGGDYRQQTLLYAIRGSDSDATVRTLVKTTSPTTWNALPRDTQSISVETIDGDTWLASVPYRIPGTTRPPNPDDGLRMSFTTAGGNVKIFQVKSGNHIADYPSGVTSTKGALNATEDGVEGLDIPVKGLSFTIRKAIDPADMTSGYLADLYNLSYTVNNASYTITVNDIDYTFAAGELLFQYATGDDQRGDGMWDLTFNFVASPNVTGITIASTPSNITGIAKKGHEYLWCIYKKVVASGKTRQYVDSVHIDQVYDPADFTGLGL